MEILADLMSEVRFGELDIDGGGQLDAVDFTGVADDGGQVDFERGAASDACFAFHAEQATRDRAASGSDLQAGASEL